MRQRLPLILSITALVVALLGWTGVGEATRNALVPKNSVGTKQIRNNQVRSGDIRDGTIRSEDIRGATISGVNIRKGTISLRHLGPNTVAALRGESAAPPPSPTSDLEADLERLRQCVNRNFAAIDSWVLFGMGSLGPSTTTCINF